jgi:hypothetical protein
MSYTDAIAHRSGHPPVALRYLVERCQALLRPVFLALAEAPEIRMARRDERLRTEMSDLMLRDIGVARDDLRAAAASRLEQWP